MMTCAVSVPAATIIWDPDVPNNFTVNTLNLSAWTLGMFDDTAILSDTNALMLPAVSTEVQFAGTENGDWSATNLSSGEYIILVAGAQFVLAITNNSGSWIDVANAAPLAVGTTNYEVIFSNNVSQVYTFDAIPTVVPVPPAVWLFGAGLLGLVVVARRKVIA